MINNVINLLRHRALLLQLWRRDSVAKYKGSYFGVAWAVMTPILMLTMYTFIFAVVFKARWGGENISEVDYALRAFCGLIIFGMFSECINRSPSLILENISFVTKVVFPLEILPGVAVLTALKNAAISLVIFFFGYILILGLPPVTVLLLPIILFPIILMCLGISWFLSAVGVFYRDMQQIVPIANALLMFGTPIFYPLSSVPEAYRVVFELNPLTYIVESLRGLVFDGTGFSLMPLLLLWLISASICFTGLFVFCKMRKAFSDVI